MSGGGPAVWFGYEADTETRELQKRITELQARGTELVERRRRVERNLEALSRKLLQLGPGVIQCGDCDPVDGYHALDCIRYPEGFV